jgi:energy-coupling factor transport system substrate-specific component
MFKRFNVRDLIIIAALASIGIAIKPIVSPLSKMLSTPLGIPGGSFAGGFYMLWLVLAVVIVNKPYAGTLFGILQAIGVLIFGLAGNQGALSLITYTVPGIVADLLYWIIRGRTKLITHLTLCAGANLAGTLLSAWLIFNHPPLFMAAIGALSLGSGLIGGYVAFGLFKTLQNTRIIQ